jgi:hypothetical protein
MPVRSFNLSAKAVVRAMRNLFLATILSAYRHDKSRCALPCPGVDEISLHFLALQPRDLR